MSADTRAVVEMLWPDKPVPAHLLRDCEIRTPAETNAILGRMQKLQGIQPAKGCEFARREQVAGYSSRRVVSR